jgi:Restriction endonuclease
VRVADEREVAFETTHYPSADITPQEFEEFVVELLESVGPSVEGLVVTPHEKIQGADGVYDFDATVRFELGGMSFLVLIEAKRHSNPIKRELVQVLHAKLQSVGAQKAAMVSTASYQRGAVDYAQQHGIALAKVTEGRFILETRAVEKPPPLTREQAAELYGLPTFVAHAYGPGEQPGWTSVTLLDTDRPSSVAEALFGVLHDDSSA